MATGVYVTMINAVVHVSSVDMVIRCIAMARLTDTNLIYIPALPTLQPWRSVKTVIDTSCAHHWPDVSTAV